MLLIIKCQITIKILTFQLQENASFSQHRQEQEKQQSEQAQNRRSLVGSGDRSERIRTYNFPQGRVTDHRINLTLYKLPDIMMGDLSPVIDPLNQEYQADQLAALGDD